MSHTVKDPIRSDWTPTPTDGCATTDGVLSSLATSPTTGRDVAALLGRYEVSDLDDPIVPLLAAAAAELALVAGIPWRFSTDDAAVALLRLIARATLTNPTATGPHTQRLAEQLARRDAA